MDGEDEEDENRLCVRRRFVWGCACRMMWLWLGLGLGLWFGIWGDFGLWMCVSACHCYFGRRVIDFVKGTLHNRHL